MLSPLTDPTFLPPLRSVPLFLASEFSYQDLGDVLIAKDTAIQMIHVSIPKSAPNVVSLDTLMSSVTMSSSVTTAVVSTQPVVLIAPDTFWSS